MLAYTSCFYTQHVCVFMSLIICIFYHSLISAFDENMSSIEIVLSCIDPCINVMWIIYWIRIFSPRFTFSSWRLLFFLRHLVPLLKSPGMENGGEINERFIVSVTIAKRVIVFFYMLPDNTGQIWEENVPSTALEYMGTGLRPKKTTPVA